MPSRRGKFRTAAIVIAVAAVLTGTVLLVRSRGSDTTALRVYDPSGASGGTSVPHVLLHRPYAYVTGIALCTTGGPVTITAVLPHDRRGGIIVTDWAVTPSMPALYGDGLLGLAANLPNFSAKQRVSWPCSDHAVARTGFAVSVATSTPRASVDGFTVESSSGSAFVPFTVVQCATSTCPDR